MYTISLYLTNVSKRLKRCAFLIHFFLSEWIVCACISVVGGNSGQTVAGTTGDTGPWSYQLSNPTSITIDQFGFLYILDFSNQRVQRWTQGATFGTTIVAAPMSNPYGMDFDRVGNIYIADTSNQRVLSFSLTCRKS